MGVHKSEKQAGGGGGSGVAAGRVSDSSVATARALALALALVPQRRVGVAVVMMWDAAEGKGAFRCGLLLRLRLRRGLPHWLWAVPDSLLPALYPSLASASAVCAGNGIWGAASQPDDQRWEGGMRRPDLPSGSSG